MAKIILNENQYKELLHILTEQVLLSEDKISKNMKKARNVIRQISPKSDPQQILNAIRHDIPNSRIADYKFMPGVARLFLTGNIENNNDILNFNQILKLIGNGVHVNEYDDNLNGLSLEELIKKFKTVAKQDVENDKLELQKKSFTKSNYKIVPIPDFNSSKKYSQYTTWCVTKTEENYDAYTNDGLGIFYFCLKDGFENVPKKMGQNTPLDEYGLSMIAVSVNPDGSLNTCTCRWNHDNNGNDSIMDTKEISNTIGANFYDVFPPRKINVLCDNEYATIFEKQGQLTLLSKKANDSNHYSQIYGNKVGIVMHGNYANLIDIKGNLLLPDWYYKITPILINDYDETHNDKISTFKVIKKDNLKNIFDVNQNKFLFNEWVDAFGPIYEYANSSHNNLIGYEIAKNHIYNLTTINGELITTEWPLAINPITPLIRNGEFILGYGEDGFRLANLSTKPYIYPQKGYLKNILKIPFSSFILTQEKIDGKYSLINVKNLTHYNIKCDGAKVLKSKDLIIIYNNGMANIFDISTQKFILKNWASKIEAYPNQHTMIVNADQLYIIYPNNTAYIFSIKEKKLSLLS